VKKKMVIPKRNAGKLKVSQFQRHMRRLLTFLNILLTVLVQIANIQAQNPGQE
jgi:hypothetical protein